MADVSRKRKQVKLKCLVRSCNQVFDDDYRLAHNRKYHKDLLSKNKCIPYEVNGAARSPFELVDVASQWTEQLKTRRLSFG